MFGWVDRRDILSAYSDESVFKTRAPSLESQLRQVRRWQGEYVDSKHPNLPSEDAPRTRQIVTYIRQTEDAKHYPKGLIVNNETDIDYFYQLRPPRDSTTGEIVDRGKRHTRDTEGVLDAVQSAGVWISKLNILAEEDLLRDPESKYIEWEYVEYIGIQHFLFGEKSYTYYSPFDGGEQHIDINISDKITAQRPYLLTAYTRDMMFYMG